MKQNNTDNLQMRIQSFSYAITGIIQLILQEANARIHLVATLLVIVAGIHQQLSKLEWIAVIIATSLVWIAEAFNTTIEMLCDLFYKDEFNLKVKIIKDIAAGAVLMAAVTSALVALFVFIN